MAETATQRHIQMARLAVALIVALVVLSAVWYGASAEVRQRAWDDLVQRPSGPMALRFILQPAMAAMAALIDGIADAESGRSPYFWTILTSPTERRSRLTEGLISTARIILLGLAIDAIYQLNVLKTFYPGEAVIIALVLGFLPYLMLRGPIARVARWWYGQQAGGSAVRTRASAERPNATPDSTRGA